MEYFKFRKEYSSLIDILKRFVLILALFLSIIWGKLVLLALGLLFLLNLIEFLFLKCDCGKRPGFVWDIFPKKCKCCGEKLRGELD